MTVGEKSVNPLPDGTSSTKREPEKKDPLRGSFFSYRPSAGAAPRSVLTSKSAALHPKCLHKAHLHINIVNIRRNCERKSLKFVV